MSGRDAVRLPDSRDRQTAVTDFRRNLVVVAGAGTGKTSLLVERILNAIGSGQQSIDRIAAMTFTEKAAGEMKHRLAGQLEQLLALARDEPVPQGGEAERSWRYLVACRGSTPQTIAERALTALEQLDRSTVTTIHGLCADLLRSHPVAAGVDPGFTVDTGEKADLLRRELWDGFVERELGRPATRRALWTRLLGRLGLADIERAAFSLADFGLPPGLLRPPFASPDSRVLLGADTRRIVDELDRLLSQQSGLGPSALTYFENAHRHLGTFLDSGHGAFIEALVQDAPFSDRILDRRKPDSFRKLEGFDAEDAKRLSGEVLTLMRSLLEIDDPTIGGLIEAVAPFVLEFREAMLRQSLVTFDGLLTRARDLLRGSPAIRQQIKNRYRMLLVDEFQDTDPVQYEIVLFLGESDESSADEAFSAELAAGKLFIVGDEKQSIYRFRGADYSAYERAVDRVIEQGGTRLELIANFRSVPGVVEPVNRLFDEGPDGCWKPSPYQPSYRGIRAVRGEAAAPSTELWTVELEGKSSAELRRRAEGELIAEQIDELVRNGAARYKEITVLFRAFTSLAPYLRPLRHRRVPFVVDGGRDFLERPEVTQLIAAIRTLAQPADPVALLAFLRSPAGGVSDRELSRYAESGGRWGYREQPSEQTYPVIARRLRLLRELEQETRSLPADAVIRHLIERTHTAPLNAAAFEGPQRVANLAKLVTVAAEISRDGRLSLIEIAEALESGGLGALESEAALADDTIDAVRISSIHRMKGLENRWIFLPDLARAAQRGRHQPVTSGLARTPTGQAVALGVGRISNSTVVWQEREDRRHEAAEETRLLYVALTRACDRLIVVAGSSGKQAPWLNALRPWGFDADAPPDDGARLCGGRVLHRRLRPTSSRRPSEPETHPPTDLAVKRYHAAVRRLDEASGAAAPSRLTDDAPALTVAPTDASAALGRVTGIVVHRLLELRRGEDLAGTRARVIELCPEVAADEGVDPTELKREVLGIVERMHESGLAARLDGLEVIGREVPMLLGTDVGRTIRGTIDLIYREAGGQVVVADFKTDRETSVDRLTELYGGQLNLYAEAVERAMATATPPERELWALRSAMVIRLPRTNADRKDPDDPR